MIILLHLNVYLCRRLIDKSQVVLVRNVICERTAGSPDRPLFDPPEARSMVGTPFVPTPPGAPPRAGAVKDRRPPEGGGPKGRP